MEWRKESVPMYKDEWNYINRSGISNPTGVVGFVHQSDRSRLYHVKKYDRATLSYIKVARTKSLVAAKLALMMLLN